MKPWLVYLYIVCTLSSISQWESTRQPSTRFISAQQTNYSVTRWAPTLWCTGLRNDFSLLLSGVDIRTMILKWRHPWRGIWITLDNYMEPECKRLLPWDSELEDIIFLFICCVNFCFYAIEQRKDKKFQISLQSQTLHLTVPKAFTYHLLDGINIKRRTSVRVDFLCRLFWFLIFDLWDSRCQKSS